MSPAIATANAIIPFRRTPTRSGLTAIDRAAIKEEVASGLRHERGRLLDARHNADYADLQGKIHLKRREAETEFDYVARIKKVTGFSHQAINRLCQHTYNPGPMRTITEDKAAEALLAEVYEANHIDALMNEAERLSTVNDVACIQVSIPEDPEYRKRKPVDLQLWGSEEFAVFLDPEDQRCVCAVVVIDQYDEQTRYRLWFPDVVHTFLTAKAGGQSGKGTAGGVIAMEVAASPEPNVYGCLPFAFVHYRAPVRQFWTNGIGSFLRESEESLNQELSDLAESIQKYGVPIGWFKNVGPEFNPEIGRGRFIRLIRGGSSYDGEGYGSAGDPEAGYLQASLAIEAIWQDLQGTMGQVAEAIDLPPAALRLDYSDAPSGISIIIRAFPLLTRARQRRPIYQWAECALARCICAVYGGFHDDAGLIASSQTLQVLLAWPEPRIPVPGPERDESDGWEISLGIKSRLQVMQERYGLSRDQAIQRLKEVADDEKVAKAILPEPEADAEPQPQPTNPGRNGSADVED